MTKAAPAAKPLTELQERFVAEMAANPNSASAAYVRAGGAKNSARFSAYDLLKKPEIRNAIAQAQRESLERTGLSADMLLMAHYEIAFADPRELSEYRRTCCRYCWGKDHQYQWTPSEFARETKRIEQQNLTRTKVRKVPLPECDGGIDFDHTRDPNSDCPECRGEGQGREFFHDTRRLTEKAARLFGGVKRTKDGIEFLQQSQEKAREVLSKHFGLIKEKLELTGRDGGPIESVNTTDPIEAARIYQKLMGGS